MANFTVVPDKAAGDVFTEAMWDTYLRDNLNDGVFRPLAEVEVGPDTGGLVAANIDFQNIPATMAHLHLVLYSRSDSASAVAALLRFNNDTAGNYDRQSLEGVNATAQAASAAAATSLSVGRLPRSTDSANMLAQHVVDIPNYANTTNYKGVVSVGSGISTTSFYASVYYGQWRSAVAISRLTLLPDVGNFVVGTRATLYGLGSI